MFDYLHAYIAEPKSLKVSSVKLKSGIEVKPDIRASYSECDGKVMEHIQIPYCC